MIPGLRLRTLLFLLLSSLKWGKLATTGGTMLLSLGVYAMIWGWRYAAPIRSEILTCPN